MYSALFVPLRMPGMSLCSLDMSDQLPRSSDKSCISSIWLHVPSPSTSLVSNVMKACIWLLELCVLFNLSTQLPLAASFSVMLHMPPPTICPCYARSLCQQISFCSFSLFQAMLTSPVGLLSHFRADSNTVQVLACSQPI